MDRSYSMATELAQTIVDGETSFARLDTLASLINRHAPDIRKPDPPPFPENRGPQGPNDGIGIWRAKQEDGMVTYMRDARHAADWRLWANQHVIYPKKGRRLVLLGESVARGYFYDPFYNPAIELRGRLQSVEGLEDTEIVDLAKSGLTLEELSQLSEACIKLDPDVIIIFAGNNWAYSLYDSPAFSGDEARELTDALHCLDMGRVKEKLNDKLAGLVKNFMTAMASLSRKHDIPVMFIIPEYNLKAWKSTPLEKIVARLPADGTDRWIAAERKARQHLAEGDLPAAQKASEEMTALDPSNPLGYEYQAACRLRSGKDEEARRLLESARDASIIKRLTNHTPRCFSVVRTTILEQARQHGFPVVDLPSVFKDHLGGKIPGSELFLDYCHLNHTGIGLAMDAAVKTVLPLLDREQEIVPAPSVEALSPDLIALAHLLAATLNSRFGQPREVLHYHCMEAVRTSRVSARFMTLFSSMACRKASATLCKSYGQILAEGLADQYNKGTGLLHADNGKVLDHQLVYAMIDALRTMGIDIHDQIGTLLNREHAVRDRAVNLLESFYHMFSIQQVAGTRSCYYKAYEGISEFLFFAEKDVPLSADLTWRVPVTGAGGSARIWLNDVLIDTADVGSKWQTQRLLLPFDGLVKGANRLAIEWPAGARAAGKADAGAGPDLATAGSLDRTIGALYHTFGEIHTFTISTIRQ